MLEIKSAWRVLDPEHDLTARFYTRPGFVLSPNREVCVRAPVGLGLVALHIHKNTRLSHVASTFEQVDNVEILDPKQAHGVVPSFNPGAGDNTQNNIWPPHGKLGFNGQLPPLITPIAELPPVHQRQPNTISRATPIPATVAPVNREYQMRFSEATLKYYQMVNTQHVKSACRMRESKHFSAGRQWNLPKCPQPKTQTLINAALEFYTQLVNLFTSQPYHYSCQDCHAHARPCGFPGENKPRITFHADFKVMSYLLSKAKFPGQTKTPPDYSIRTQRLSHRTVSGRRQLIQNVDDLHLRVSNALPP